MFSLHPRHICKLICIALCLVALVQLVSLLPAARADATTTTLHATSTSAKPKAPPDPADIRIDKRLPMQTANKDSTFSNVNVKFGSRFDFTILPGKSSVHSGTDGVFHDNEASYVVGMAPSGSNATYIFHMGKANPAQGDAYIINEHWIEGLNTTRWVGDAPNNEGMHIIVDFIDTFRGEPGCTAIADCANAVKDDTVPILIVGISLQNSNAQPQTGRFVFGSNRALPASNACVSHTTPGGTPANVLSYDPSSDVSGGTLFLAGNQSNWSCNTALTDRAGLAWNYRVGSMQTSTAYLILGGWNSDQHLFTNPALPAGCQNEGLYASQEWSSLTDVVNFAFDNLSTRDNLLGEAQVMENYLINNNTLSPAQRWVIGDTLRSYKASSWLMGRQGCAGGGYDTAVYEGTYGFLSTVDVMHEYGYFEITRVPWFFKSAITQVFNNATSNAFGTYFQHDQGADVDKKGNCLDPGQGIPSFRATCYAPPKVGSGVPMPTEENDNVVLLMAYYVFVTGDTSFLQQHIAQLDAAMQHNIKVGDPATGIAYNGQDTNTTYDAASDCLHNDDPQAGNMYYQGLKEATGYHATAYLDSLIPGNQHGADWNSAAAKIEQAMVQEYNHKGYLPIAESDAFTNCDGRTITLGESLFYLHLIGQDGALNQTLLRDIAAQYPTDLRQSTLPLPITAGTSTPTDMILMTTTRASGPQCDTGHCLRYEWFSKVMLSGIVADMVYSKYGCSSCQHLDLVQAAHIYNVEFNGNFGDGFHDDGSDWGGHSYPRGIISWAFLSSAY